MSSAADDPAEHHPLNLNSPEFDAEAYVASLILRKRLDELVAVEEDMVQNVRRLDNEMQHLVYENYNKFLTATNTVRQMQTEFHKMDEQMVCLSDKMARISALSSDLSGIFREHRESVRKLTDASKTVKSLQYVVKLPQRLQTYYDKKNYRKAIKSFIAVKSQLERVRTQESIKGIYRECCAIMAKIEKQLRQTLTSPVLSSEDFEDTVRLLNQLGTPLPELEAQLAAQWHAQIRAQLEPLEVEAGIRPPPDDPPQRHFNDILDFVENGVCPLLADISLIASLYVSLFKPEADSAFLAHLKRHMLDLKALLVARFERERSGRECALYVRALDRVYRRLSACAQLIPHLDFGVENTGLVVDAAHHQIHICRQAVLQAVHSALDEIGNELSVKSPSGSSSSSGRQRHNNSFMAPLLAKLEQTFLVSVKTSLANLLLFTASDITFLTSQESVHSFSSFGVDVHEQVVVAALSDVAKFAAEKCADLPAENNLILGLFLHAITKKNLKYLMDLCQEQYKLTEEVADALLTRPPDVVKEIDEAALTVLAKFAEQQGHQLYTALVANSTDWPQAKTSPQQIREETKALVREVQALDETLQVLMEDSTKKERTPDSMRGLAGSRRIPAHLAANPHHHHGQSQQQQQQQEQRTAPDQLAGALERMWADAQEELAAPKLDFKRYALLGCALDKCLRAYLDWVRGAKFTRFGVQQLQVDSFFLKQTLWRFVADEMAMNMLVDEALTAAVNLCEDPKLLEPGVVKEISAKAQ